MRLGWCGGGGRWVRRNNDRFSSRSTALCGSSFRARELDERLGLSELMDRHLSDSRRGKNIQLPLADLLRQSIYSRLAGYEDVNDATRLSQDPTFRLIGSRKIWERGAALTSRLQSFEIEVLTQEETLP